MELFVVLSLVCLLWYHRIIRLLAAALHAVCVVIMDGVQCVYITACHWWSDWLTVAVGFWYQLSRNKMIIWWRNVVLGVQQLRDILSSTHCVWTKAQANEPGGWGWSISPEWSKTIIFRANSKFFGQNPVAKNEKKIIKRKKRDGIHSIQRYEVPEIRDFY